MKAFSYINLDGVVSGMYSVFDFCTQNALCLVCANDRSQLQRLYMKPYSNKVRVSSWIVQCLSLPGFPTFKASASPLMYTLIQRTLREVRLRSSRSSDRISLSFHYEAVSLRCFETCAVLLLRWTLSVTSVHSTLQSPGLTGKQQCKWDLVTFGKIITVWLKVSSIYSKADPTWS